MEKYKWSSKNLKLVEYLIPYGGKYYNYSRKLEYHAPHTTWSICRQHVLRKGEILPKFRR